MAKAHHPRHPNEPRKLRTPWFWWCVAIALAACFAVFTWTGIPYVFAFPERSTNYKLLERLDRLPKPAELKVGTAPAGTVIGPTNAYQMILSLPDDQRLELNQILKRQLLSNFSTREIIYYLEGTYTVLEVMDLNESHPVTEGIAVKAQAMIRPDEYREPTPFPLIIEYILPNAKSAQKIFYKKGESFTLKRYPSFCTLLHAEKMTLANDNAAVLTVMPIINGIQKTPDEKNISVSLNEKYNLDAEFPIWPLKE